MIKSSALFKNGVDVSKYFKVKAYLKRKSQGYRPKKSKILTQEQVERFMNEAPDEKYLMVKVATIFGLFGACRREELCNLLVEDIEVTNKSLIIQIPNTKTKVSRSFCIVGKYVDYFRKYFALRPSGLQHHRFFLKYTNNKCTANPVGINTFGKMLSVVAEFLRLPEPKQFTGHCYRRSSASLLAESGANITEIKKHGGWKSTTVAEGYVDHSMSYKNAIAEIFLPTSNNSADYETSNSTVVVPADTSYDDGTGSSSNVLQSSLTSQGINVNNCSRCTFTINIHKK